MEKVTDFTKVSKQDFTTLRRDIEKALAGLEAKHGIKFHAGNIRMDVGYAEIKVTASIVHGDGVVETKAAGDYRQLATAFGLKPEWLYKTFEMMGVTYKVMGLNQKKYKFPVIAERVRDKQSMCVSLDAVIKSFVGESKAL